MTISDPVQIGFVACMSRPEGNLTGASQLNVEVAPKRLELMHEAIPTAPAVALLVNPTSPVAETVSRDLQAASSPAAWRCSVSSARPRSR
jgi:putative ABC transport system substrate-binding protein